MSPAQARVLATLSFSDRCPSFPQVTRYPKAFLERPTSTSARHVLSPLDGYAANALGQVCLSWCTVRGRGSDV